MVFQKSEVEKLPQGAEITLFKSSFCYFVSNIFDFIQNYSPQNQRIVK
jgi:hypothetical protein